MEVTNRRKKQSSALTWAQSTHEVSLVLGASTVHTDKEAPQPPQLEDGPPHPSAYCEPPPDWTEGKMASSHWSSSSLAFSLTARLSWTALLGLSILTRDLCTPFLPEIALNFYLYHSPRPPCSCACQCRDPCLTAWRPGPVSLQTRTWGRSCPSWPHRTCF